jgi:hypothetical protein
MFCKASSIYYLVLYRRKPAVLEPVCNPDTWEAVTEGSRVQGRHGLCIKTGNKKIIITIKRKRREKEKAFSSLG